MAAHSKPLIAALALVAWIARPAAVPHASQAATADAAPKRIISLVPNVTEVLFAVGAGPQVVAVSSFDSYPPEVTKLPRVGALLNPDVERLLSLRPDLVVVYGSQSGLEQQLARAHIAVYSYRHGGLADVLETIRAVGSRTGHAGEGRRVADDVERKIDAVRARVKPFPRPRTLLVFGRERLALRGIYASGGRGFLADMLDAAGGDNLFADVNQEAVQASTEVILTKQPEAIVEVRAATNPIPAGERDAELDVWKALASVRAVRDKRLAFLVDDRLVVPGPRIGEGTELLARALHPDAFR
jgi:iron complex transport system substrate-binding protein